MDTKSKRYKLERKYIDVYMCVVFMLLYCYDGCRQVSWNVWRGKSILICKALACLLSTTFYTKRLHTCQSQGLSFHSLFSFVIGLQINRS